VGEPPNYQRILAAQRDEPPVGWKLLWNSRPVGWALSKTARKPHGLSEVRSLVHLDQLRLSEMVPKPLQRIVPLDYFTDRLEVEARSVLVLSDSLAPQSRLPNLREGQEWTVETYSPLLALSQAGQQKVPTEILHARVEGLAPVVSNGRQVEAWVVVFRGDPGSSLTGGGDVRGKMWVTRDGVILKQEVQVFSATMTFVRQGDDEAERLYRRHSADLEKEQMIGPVEPAGAQPGTPR
jgi:hypothetical protein